MATKKFFEERTDQSEIKARIVQKYFKVWASVVKAAARQHGGRIAYIDLYAGPGRYEDGSASTPLMVLETAIADSDLREMLVTMFNDGNADLSATLKNEIAALKGIETLKHPPAVYNTAVGAEVEARFANLKLIPTFSFFDPWGYKGLSLGIVRALIKDWGCDCVFFFNYNRINAGISNRAVDEHMDALFGKTRADKLRVAVAKLSPAKREALILEELASAIRELGGTYVLPFKFKNSSGARLSHCLVFVSKHVRGYEIMKQIMAQESSTADQGVPSFVYSPADETTPLLFSLSRPLDALEGQLLNTFAGKSLPMKKIYEQHHVDTPYIDRNYKGALRNLEAAGKITADPPAEKRRQRGGVVTFADAVVVNFPIQKKPK